MSEPNFADPNTLRSMRLVRLLSPVALLTDTLLNTWESHVFRRAIWKNDPHSQGMLSSVDVFAPTEMYSAYIRNVSRGGRVTPRQVMAIISAYRETAKALKKTKIDKEFITHMINEQPEILGKMDRLDVGAVAALVPGMIDPSDGVLYRWLVGEDMTSDQKIYHLLDTMAKNVNASIAEVGERVTDTRRDLESTFKKITPIVAIAAGAWLIANLKTIFKR